MASLAAKLAAKKVSESVRSGKKPNLGKILLSVGYPKSTSKSPTRVTKTKSYKEEIYPVVQEMERQRDRMIEEIKKRKFDKEKLRDITDAIDKLTKNAQLLQGKSTNNDSISFSWE